MYSHVWRYVLRGNSGKLHVFFMTGPKIDEEKAMDALKMHFSDDKVVSLTIHRRSENPVVSPEA